MSDLQSQRNEYHRIHAIEVDAQALQEVTRLAAESTEPMVRALAKAEEVTRARNLGRQQLAVVAGAELLDRLEALTAGGVPSEDPYLFRRLITGLNCAISSALDLPEVSFAAIDALIDELERFLDIVGRKPYSAWLKRARRHYSAGDEAKVFELSRALLPHINYTNGVREKLGCPACVLDSLAWFMGPEADPELVYEVLRAVLEHDQSYPNEDPEYFRMLLQHNPGLSCDSVETCFARYGRALVYAGRHAEARELVMRGDPYDGAEVFLLPMVIRIEYALAADDGPELELWARELEQRMFGHEDIDEAFQAALRVAQARRRLAARGEGSEAEHAEGIRAALAHAEASAARLDTRLDTPRYAEWLAGERAGPPPFCAEA